MRRWSRGSIVYTRDDSRPRCGTARTRSARRTGERTDEQPARLVGQSVVGVADHRAVGVRRRSATSPGGYADRIGRSTDGPVWSAPWRSSSRTDLDRRDQPCRAPQLLHRGHRSRPASCCAAREVKSLRESKVQIVDAFGPPRRRRDVAAQPPHRARTRTARRTRATTRCGVASCSCTVARSTASRRRLQTGAAVARAHAALLQGRQGEGRDRARQGQDEASTSARTSPSATPNARRSGRSVGR